MKDTGITALLSDSYKYSHYEQYPPKTEKIYSYFESRGGEFGFIIPFGITYYIKRYLTGKVITPARIQRMKKLIDGHMGPGTFNEEGFNRLYQKYGGYLPIKIYALPEGTVAGVRQPLMAVENTDTEFFWLTNFLESLLVQAWYPTTVASNSFRSRKLIKKYLEETSTLEGEEFEGCLNFRLHDFGQRGVSSVETGGIGGMAHLLSFLGTDTVSAMIFAQDWYNEDDDFIAGFSIPASEHSTITSWGKENEIEAFRNMLEKHKDYPLVACVSDSYDIRDAVDNKWGKVLKDDILEREGTLVIRPDSGDPVFTTEYIAKSLWNNFGGKVNDKGFKVLDSHVRIIQGDGIDYQMIDDILANFKKLGFSAENIAFGSGGGLLQKWDRDTAKFAFKCSEAIIDGESVDVRKYPMSFDSEGNYSVSSKISKAGRFDDELELIFEDGKLLKEEKFSDIRKRVMASA